MHGRLTELGFIYINVQRVNGTWLEIGMDWTIYLVDMWLVTLGGNYTLFCGYIAALYQLYFCGNYNYL